MSLEPPTHLVLEHEGIRQLYRLADVVLTDQQRNDMEHHGARILDVAAVAPNPMEKYYAPCGWWREDLVDEIVCPGCGKPRMEHASFNAPAAAATEARRR